jgi:hypothetical protein
MTLAEEGKDFSAFPFFNCLTTLSRLTDLVVVVGGTSGVVKTPWGTSVLT